MAASDCIDAYIDIPSLPGLRGLLVISAGALKLLSPYQLEAILAHEIGHLKCRHELTLAVLTFVSRWTFLGEGFLTAWMRESTQLEREADAFAIAWLERKDRSRLHLLDALRLLEEQRISQALANIAGSRLGVSVSSWMLPIQILEEAIKGYPCYEWPTKLKTLLRVFYLYYFYGWQATYRYLPYEQRMQYIQHYHTAETPFYE
jgi:hypothetical protein